MSSYQITLIDRSTEEIVGVDAYQQEGQMTTFFANGAGRTVVDTWSTRIASFRTSEILAIRQVPAATTARTDLRADAGPAAPRVPSLRSA